MHSSESCKQAFEDIRHAFESGRMAQAYLISASPRGAGRELAERIAALLLCRASKAGQRPCGTCAGCRTVADRNHPDAVWIEPRQKSRRILIEQVRDLRRFISQTSYAGGWKVCALLGADRLGPEAANAFLKVLEEPPPNCLFLLVSDQPQAIITTVMSRCQRVLLGGEEPAGVDDWSGEVADLMALGGSMAGLAGLVQAERVAAVFGAMRAETEKAEKESSGESGQDEEKEVVDARAAALYKETRTSFMRALLLWQRDILMIVQGMGDEGLRFSPHAAALRRQAAGLTLKAALARIEMVESMQSRMEENVAEPAVLLDGFCALSQTV